MQLDNRTPWQGMVQVADLGEPTVPAAVIFKATYDLQPDGSLTPAADPMPISADQIETPFGNLHGELFFKKRGADVCVLGTVHRSAPVREALLTLTVGNFSHRLTVSGDRTWIPTGDRRQPLAASRPQPFTEMPLGYSHAFGGTADYEGFPAVWADNPVGRGYYLSVEQAKDHPLPNIEAGDEPRIRSWEDRPRASGWGPYPMNWGLRASAAVKVDDKKMAVASVDPSLFNNAHPDLVVPALSPGDTIQIDGLRDERLAFALPRTLVRLQIDVAAQVAEVVGRIDGVFLWADAGKLVITQRATFSYEFRPREVRRVTATAVAV
jgi:hypothetical protein